MEQHGDHKGEVLVCEPNRKLVYTWQQADTPERTDRAIFLNLQLGAALLVAEDYADPAVGAAFQRAQQLAEQANALPPLLTALAGLHGYHAARAQLTDSARRFDRSRFFAASPLASV